MQGLFGRNADLHRAIGGRAVAVVCDALSVVIRTSTLEEKFLGGVVGYKAQVPNKTFATDGMITRVGVMNLNDLQVYIDQLSDWGLRLFGTDDAGQSVAVDISVIDQVNGFTILTPWLETAVRDGVRIAWLAGADPGEVQGPKGWTPASTATFIRHEPSDAPNLLFARCNDPGAMSVLDPSTGDVAFMPEPQTSYGTHLSHAKAAFDEGDTGEALRHLRLALRIRPLQPEDREIAARILHSYAQEYTELQEFDPKWHTVARAWEETVRLGDAPSDDASGAWAYALARCGELARADEVLAGMSSHSSEWAMMAAALVSRFRGESGFPLMDDIYDIVDEVVFEKTRQVSPELRSALLGLVYEIDAPPPRPKPTKANASIKKPPAKRAVRRRIDVEAEKQRDDTD